MNYFQNIAFMPTFIILCSPYFRECSFGEYVQYVICTTVTMLQCKLARCDQFPGNSSIHECPCHVLDNRMLQWQLVIYVRVILMLHLRCRPAVNGLDKMYVTISGPVTSSMGMCKQGTSHGTYTYLRQVMMLGYKYMYS